VVNAPQAQQYAAALGGAGIAGYGFPGLAPQLPVGLVADSIPHQDLKYPTPERLARQQAQGLPVPLNLLTDIEYARICPGFEQLSKPQKSELAYSLVGCKRLDDVLVYLEAVSWQEAALDLRRLHGVLTEIRDVSKAK